MTAIVVTSVLVLSFMFLLMRWLDRPDPIVDPDYRRRVKALTELWPHNVDVLLDECAVADCVETPEPDTGCCTFHTGTTTLGLVLWGATDG